MKEHEIKYQGGVYNVKLGSYTSTKTPCITIMDGHIPFGVASVNLPEENHYLKNGEIFIKNYSENVGMFESLVAAGIIRDTGKTVNLGFTEVNIAELLVSA